MTAAPFASAATGRMRASGGATESAASTMPVNARIASSAPSLGGSFEPCSAISATDPTKMSAPAASRSMDSRRVSSLSAGTRRNKTKNAVPRPSAMPAYDRARPAISSGSGGGALAPTSGTAGSGPLPTTNAKLPFVVCPSTALVAVHATR